MKKNRTNRIKAMLITILCLAALAGCGEGASADMHGHCFSDDVKPVVEAPVTEAVKEPEAETEAPSASPVLAEEPIQEPESKEPEAEEAKEPELESVEGVARLSDMVGLWQMDLFFNNMGYEILVDTEADHNPYDLTWRYGPEVKGLSRCLDDPEWDSLYRSYVKACDWSLVFDADYYKNAFPMLAKLYHDDDALLLEHFQTQGVHEGRQASAGFNVAAYMENCDNTLVEAFGDNCECYYFYYMLNHDAEKSVDAKNPDGQYPHWLSVELSLQQSWEHSMVNSYRKEDGVDPVEVHPELVALANYRAWYDAEHNMYAHDWCKMDETRGDIDDCFDRLSLDTWSENTHKWYHTSLKGRYEGFYLKYRQSESHNEAMVRAAHHWAGHSNPYISDNPGNIGTSGKETDKYTGYCAQFDIYSETAPKSPWDLY